MSVLLPATKISSVDSQADRSFESLPPAISERANKEEFTKILDEKSTVRKVQDTPVDKKLSLARDGESTAEEPVTKAGSGTSATASDPEQSSTSPKRQVSNTDFNSVEVSTDVNKSVGDSTIDVIDRSGLDDEEFTKTLNTDPGIFPLVADDSQFQLGFHGLADNLSPHKNTVSSGSTSSHFVPVVNILSGAGTVSSADAVATIARTEGAKGVSLSSENNATSLQMPTPFVSLNSRVDVDNLVVNSAKRLAYSSGHPSAEILGTEKAFFLLNNALSAIGLGSKITDRSALTSLSDARQVDQASAISSAGAHIPSLMSPVEPKMQMPVTISFGQPGWANMVAERSAMMAFQNIRFAELQLDPPELGPLQVKVTVNQDQAAVSFTVANSQVKEALDYTVARLRELLGEQGIDLFNVDVSDQSSKQSNESDDESLASHIETEDESAAESAPVLITLDYSVDYYA